MSSNRKPATPVTEAPTASGGELVTRLPAKAMSGLQGQGLKINLRKIPLLAELNDDELAEVQANLRIRPYVKRDVVLHKGGSGDGLLFLLSGQLQVTDVTEDGRAIGLRMLVPGDFFGEIALINNSTRTASVVAMNSVLVGFLPAATALHLFSHSPPVARQMLGYLAQKIQRDSEFRALLSINNTTKRIFTFLVLMQRPADDGPQAIENLPTHQDIANMINTSRETVTRALLTLVQQGIIEKQTQRLVIRDPAALQSLIQA